MAAESFLVSSIIVFGETREETVAFASRIHIIVGTPGVCRTADPRGSVVLESPVAAKKMSAAGFLVRTAGKCHCKQQDEGNNDF